MGTEVYIAGIITGFCSGIGTGLANWLLIKRLEHIENIILKKEEKK